jgi:hypothetical protein
MQDIWELPNRVAEALIDTKSPLLVNETMTLWELGNTYIMSAREVMANNDRMANSSLPTANVTTDMQLNRHWHFVAANGPGPLFEAYKGMMDALVARAMGQVKQVRPPAPSLLALCWSSPHNSPLPPLMMHALPCCVACPLLCNSYALYLCSSTVACGTA